MDIMNVANGAIPVTTTNDHDTLLLCTKKTEEIETSIKDILKEQKENTSLMIVMNEKVNKNTEDILGLKKSYNLMMDMNTNIKLIAQESTYTRNEITAIKNDVSAVKTEVEVIKTSALTRDEQETAVSVEQVLNNEKAMKYDDISNKVRDLLITGVIGAVIGAIMTGILK